MNLEMISLQIEQETYSSQEKRNKLLNWFKHQNLLIQLDIFIEQRNQYFKLKQQYGDSNTTALSAFYLAINLFYKKESELKAKNKSEKLDLIEFNSNFLVKKYKTVNYKPKYQKLLTYWSVIEKLKQEKFSYRKMSNYLRSRHKFDVSHQYIRKMWERLKND